MDVEIPGFELVSRLGAGGFGAVWLARQPSVDRDVAVKVGHYPLADDVARVRFERECRALGRLSGNSNIVGVHVAGTLDDGRPYLVLEYVGGGTLWSLVNERAIPGTELAQIGQQVCNALKHAHDQEILHRDIKPENVLLRSDGSAVLGDFGIAVLSDGAATSAAVTASIPFAAPEILSGAPANTATDLYSVGATILAGATRRVPFSEPTDEGVHPIVNRVLTTNPTDLRTIGYPDDLAATVERLMARDPTQRPATAAEAEAMFEALGPARQQAADEQAAESPAGPTRLVSPTPNPAPVSAPAPAPAPVPVPASVLSGQASSPPLPPGAFPQTMSPATSNGFQVQSESSGYGRYMAVIGVVVVLSFFGGGLVWLLGQNDGTTSEAFDSNRIVSPATDPSGVQGPDSIPSAPTITTTPIVDSTTTTVALGPLSLPLTAEDAGLPSNAELTDLPDQAGRGLCNITIGTQGLAEEQNSFFNDFNGNDQMNQSVLRFDNETNAAVYLTALVDSLVCSSWEDVTLDDSSSYTIRSIAIEPVRLFGDETKAWESTVEFENGFEVVQRSYVMRRADRIVGVSFTTDERPKLEQVPDLMGLMVERLGYGT